MKQSSIDRLAQRILLVQQPKSEWQKTCDSLVVRPEGTNEFEDLIQNMMERYENIIPVEEAAIFISKNINILFYQRHPAEHMVLLAAII